MSEGVDEPSSVRLTNKLVSELDEELLIYFAKDLGWQHANFSSLERFGNSGSFLYVLHNDDARIQPRVVKVGPRNKIQGERQAWKRIEGYFPDIGGREPSFRANKKRAALCFRLFDSGEPQDSVRDLDKVYLQALNGNAKARDECVRILSKVYEDLSSAHGPSPVQDVITYGESYDWYLRRSRKSRVGQMFEQVEQPLQYGSYLVRADPLSDLPNLLLLRTEQYAAHAIHGDLHLSNVVISSHTPKIIDFAWGVRNSHVMKDFVIMESSLRFMRFPRHIHPSILLRIDEMLNNQWEVGGAIDLIRKVHNRPARRTLECMVHAVQIIRSACETAISRYKTSTLWQREYFRCLFLVLAGQQSFPSFPLSRTIVSLDQLRLSAFGAQP